MRTNAFVGKLRSFTRRQEELAEARAKIARKNKTLEGLRRRLEAKEQELAKARAMLAATQGETHAAMRPENFVWLFGSGRTGSTWLGSMLGDLRGHATWNEPYLGEIFGSAYLRAWGWQRAREHFVLGNAYKGVWQRSIRTFVLDGAAARFSEVTSGGYLVIREPHGTIGAPLLMEALPESRMILLVRDPRDVAASALDAHRENSWTSKLMDRSDGATFADDNPSEFVTQRARVYLLDFTSGKAAYDAHEGPKIIVKYEDLRYDTLGELKRIVSGLGIPIEEEPLRHVVEKHAWENIPADQKGPGKPRRKATPGGWKEDLTPEQAEIVKEIASPVFNEFY